jgi:hypothetical protein
MPRPPPVTSAVRPSRSPTRSILLDAALAG